MRWKMLRLRSKTSRVFGFAPWNSIVLRHPMPSTQSRHSARDPDAELFYLIGEDNLPHHRSGIVSRISATGAVRRARSLRHDGRRRHSIVRRDRIFPRRISETGLPRAVPFGISYRRRSSELSAVTTLYRKITDRPEKLAKTCADLAADKKAEEIVVLDLRGISTFTDFFVICSGTSEPHLKAIAGEIEGRLKIDHGLRPVLDRRISGEPVDRARLHASHRARFSSRKARVLQSGRLVGRRPSPSVEASRRETLRLFRQPLFFLRRGCGRSLCW